MGRKRRTDPVVAPKPGAAGGIRGLLAGQPTIASVVGLLVTVTLVGVSGGYLVYRIMGPGEGELAASRMDPGARWRARLLQNPTDVEALLALAHVHLDQQQLDAAESLYKQVLVLESKNVEAIDHLGTVLLGRRQVDAALARYEEALALDPRYVHALWDKANLLQYWKKDYAGAIATWEAFIQVVGVESQDGKTAQRFIAEARKAMGDAMPIEKGAGGKS